ncbi:hypothetical protein F383_09687 [Gossypium arboreum]|nr:hypothetical protein F383_09687 [Gossypium arboreum]
MYPSCS